jgi:hypothetical protein
MGVSTGGLGRERKVVTLVQAQQVALWVLDITGGIAFSLAVGASRTVR